MLGSPLRQPDAAAALRRVYAPCATVLGSPCAMPDSNEVPWVQPQLAWMANGESSAPRVAPVQFIKQLADIPQTVLLCAPAGAGKTCCQLDLARTQHCDDSIVLYVDVNVLCDAVAQGTAVSLELLLECAAVSAGRGWRLDQHGDFQSAYKLAQNQALSGKVTWLLDECERGTNNFAVRRFLTAVTDRSFQDAWQRSFVRHSFVLSYSQSQHVIDGLVPTTPTVTLSQWTRQDVKEYCHAACERLGGGVDASRWCQDLVIDVLAAHTASDHKTCIKYVPLVVEAVCYAACFASHFGNADAMPASSEWLELSIGLIHRKRGGVRGIDVVLRLRNVVLDRARSEGLKLVRAAAAAYRSYRADAGRIKLHDDAFPKINAAQTETPAANDVCPATVDDEPAESARAASLAAPANSKALVIWTAAVAAAAPAFPPKPTTPSAQHPAPQPRAAGRPAAANRRNTADAASNVAGTTAGARPVVQPPPLPQCPPQQRPAARRAVASKCEQTHLGVRVLATAARSGTAADFKAACAAWAGCEPVMLPTRNKRAILCVAARYGNVDVMRSLLPAAKYAGTGELLGSGNDLFASPYWLVLEHTTTENTNVVHFAAHSGRLGAVDFLIHRGADPTATTAAGYTVVHLAVMSGHAMLARGLIEVFALDVDARAADGTTPLHLAVMRGDVDLAVWLACYCRANLWAVTNDGKTLLHLAAQHGRWVLAGLMLGEGANPNALTASGATAADLAAENGHDGLADCLVHYASLAQPCGALPSLHSLAKFVAHRGPTPTR